MERDAVGIIEFASGVVRRLSQFLRDDSANTGHPERNWTHSSSMLMAFVADQRAELERSQGRMTRYDHRIVVEGFMMENGDVVEGFELPIPPENIIDATFDGVPATVLFGQGKDAERVDVFYGEHGGSPLGSDQNGRAVIIKGEISRWYLPAHDGVQRRIV